jgi:hypothetical protein
MIKISTFQCDGKVAADRTMTPGKKNLRLFKSPADELHTPDLNPLTERPEMTIVLSAAGIVTAITATWMTIRKMRQSHRIYNFHHCS